MTAQLPPANVRSCVKKRELEDQEKYLPRGKRMVNASLKAVKKKGEKEAAAPKALRPEVRESRKLKATGSIHLKEISAANLTRTTAARSIGSGTFGTCYPGKYRGIDVVIKEYKERSCGVRLSSLQREAKHEASITRVWEITQVFRTYSVFALNGNRLASF